MADLDEIVKKIIEAITGAAPDQLADIFAGLYEQYKDDLPISKFWAIINDNVPEDLRDQVGGVLPGEESDKPNGPLAQTGTEPTPVPTTEPIELPEDLQNDADRRTAIITAGGDGQENFANLLGAVGRGEISADAALTHPAVDTDQERAQINAIAEARSAGNEDPAGIDGSSDTDSSGGSSDSVPEVDTSELEQLLPILQSVASGERSLEDALADPIINTDFERDRIRAVAEARAQESDPLTATSYIVQGGDLLPEIAQAHGVTIAELRDENDLDGNLIRVGQQLIIPRGEDSSSASDGGDSEPSASSTNQAVDLGAYETFADVLRGVARGEIGADQALTHPEVDTVIERKQIEAIAKAYEDNQANGGTSPGTTPGSEDGMPPSTGLSGTGGGSGSGGVGEVGQPANVSSIPPEINLGNQGEFYMAGLDQSHGPVTTGTPAPVAPTAENPALTSRAYAKNAADGTKFSDTLWAPGQGPMVPKTESGISSIPNGIQLGTQDQFWMAGFDNNKHPGQPVTNSTPSPVAPTAENPALTQGAYEWNQAHPDQLRSDVGILTNEKGQQVDARGNVIANVSPLAGTQYDPRVSGSARATGTNLGGYDSTDPEYGGGPGFNRATGAYSYGIGPTPQDTVNLWRTPNLTAGGEVQRDADGNVVYFSEMGPTAAFAKQAYYGPNGQYISDAHAGIVDPALTNDTTFAPVGNANLPGSFRGDGQTSTAPYGPPGSSTPPPLTYEAANAMFSGAPAGTNPNPFYTPSGGYFASTDAPESAGASWGNLTPGTGAHRQAIQDIFDNN